MTKVVVEIEDVIGQFEDYDAEIRRLKKLYTDAEVKAAAHLNEIERLREALHTIVCNTEPDAIKHRDYDHLAQNIYDCARIVLEGEK